MRIMAVAFIALIAAVGCQSPWQTASDAAALDRAVQDGAEIVEQYAPDLDDDERDIVESAWGEIEAAHEAMHAGDPAAIHHYARARLAYAQLRDVVERRWGMLGHYEQQRLLDIDMRAQRLDDQLRESDAQQLAREAIEIATMLAPYIGVVAR